MTDFFYKMVERERINFLIGAKVALGLELKTLKEDFISHLVRYWEEEEFIIDPFTEEELRGLRRFSKATVWCICDDKEKGHWFILLDNNIVIPEACFLATEEREGK